MSHRAKSSVGNPHRRKNVPKYAIPGVEKLRVCRPRLRKGCTQIDTWQRSDREGRTFWRAEHAILVHVAVKTAVSEQSNLLSLRQHGKCETRRCE